ncbi:PGF-pre-PGF domain-containing protein [Methanosarcina sp. T3]|uniref:PGF-pre-PGF domain-containing protein n=1 Tax=Methanosarcina sp. T3 TaxID=3439062 RepID=UPI003F84512F
MQKMKRELSVLFMLILVLQVIAGSAAAATIYVDDDGSGNYTTIQAALNDAVSGDTIIVNPGTYPGNVTITVPDLVLVSSSPYNAIIRATKDAFYLNANNITIKGFDIIGSGSSSGYSGIVDSSFFCTIQNNKISNFNTGIGVYNGNEGGGGSIINNDIFDCSEGILLWSSNDNGISGNRISNCESGLSMVDSYGTLIYNNNFNNNLNVQFTDTSTWNATKTFEKNIIGGPYIGGNYWATPAGDGFSQTHSDANGDGIAEEPYYMNEVNIDYLPLVTPRTEPEPVLPVSNFRANTTRGHAPLSVFFTDLSENAVSWSWDFDNNGQPDSAIQNPVYVYDVPGSYTVNLTVSNSNGTASNTAVITVLEEIIPILPVAGFTVNKTSGYYPLTVLFTDTSRNATGRSWDVNNDGIEDSNKANFAYTYTSKGTYKAKLTAINGNGTDTETAVITVLEEEAAILPVAAFSTNVTSGYYPLAVFFTDLSQNASSRSWDVNGDGVEDSNEKSFVYVYPSRGTYGAKLTAINENGTDIETAVITVLEEEAAVLPVAAFSTNVTSGYYPLAVLFTDLSQNASSRSWDVNGDGVEDSDETSFVYVYPSRGTYEAKLTVSNANGTDTETATIDVEKKSSGGSSSGGGGGGGGSPEPAKNVKVKELAQVFITNGKAVKFDFTKNATCVVYVSFDAKKNAGKTTTIVEELKGKSSLVSALPAGEVYKSFNVWVGNSGYATSKNIENPVICFKVEKIWMEDKSVDQTSITLNRYSDKKWEQLQVNLSGEDDTYLYFTSGLPGFSSFAITGISKAASENVTEKGTFPETRGALQDDGNESTGPGTDDEQEGSTKFSDISSAYGIIGIIFLGLICAIIYLKLPK